MAVGLLLDVWRRVSAADRYVRAGRWVRDGDFPLGLKVLCPSFVQFSEVYDPLVDGLFSAHFRKLGRFCIIAIFLISKLIPMNAN